jgi:DinB superfamily
MEDGIYQKEEIVAALQENSLHLINWVAAQNIDSFGTSINEKWSTAQQISHLAISSRALSKALSKPKFVLKWLFGTSNRDTRSYLTVVEKYQRKLSKGGLATSPFRPKSFADRDKKAVLDEYVSAAEKLEHLVNKLSEKDLDKYILPHPLLGRMPLREMLFFTIYHTQHHANSIKELYGEQSVE